MRRDAVVIALGLAACGSARPTTTDAPTRPTLCAGFDDEACQDRALVQSVCLVEPDHASCEPLRAEGLLPPAPPPIEALLRCWQIEIPRDDVRGPWFCLGARDVALHAGARWDVWPHGGWTRDDTPAQAAWTATLDDGRQLWLIIAPGGPRLLDDRGLVAATLGPGDAVVRATVHERRARLPRPSAVCAAAQACRAAIPRPSVSFDAEVELEPDPIAGLTTLATCTAAWRDATDELLRARSMQRAPSQAVPAPCGRLDFDAHVGATIVPPFVMLDGTTGE